MPLFSKSVPAKAVMVEQGWPVYLLGTRQATDGQYNVTSVAVASNIATVGVTGWSGPLPVVGAAVSIVGTQTNSGVFNVSGSVLTAVSVDQTGTGTVSFALTNANVGTTPDVGKLYVRFSAVGDAVTSAGGASIAGSVANVVGRAGNWITATIFLSSGITAATVNLQGSNTNNDADFQNIQAITLASGTGSASVETSYEFLRFNITGVTGSGTAVGTINA